MYIRKLSTKKVLFFTSGILVFLLLFGLIGNARNSATQESSDIILEVGHATDEFMESSIPKPFFWGYIYIASPIGNFQNAIEYAHPEENFKNLQKVIIRWCTPNFISKRLSRAIPENDMRPSLSKRYFVSSVFNASGVYYDAYLDCGWLGAIWMYIFMIIVILVYVVVIPTSSRYFLIGWAVICSVITLNTFNNMWYYDGGLTVLLLVFITVFFEHYRRHVARGKSKDRAFINNKELYER